MTVYKAFRYRIYPTKEQERFLSRHFGGSRFIYNYFLDLRKTEYQEHKRCVSGFDCKRQLPVLKMQFPWLKDVNSQSLQDSVLNLEKAYRRFFKGLAGYLQFKKKRNHQSFTVPQHFSIQGDRFFIPKLKKGIKTKFHRPIEGTVNSLTISRTLSGRYFVSFTCDAEIFDMSKSIDTIGIDLGLKTLVRGDNDLEMEPPSYYRNAEKRLKILQGRLSRKKKGSRNKGKARLRVAKHHEKVVNQRKDFLHKISHRIVNENQVIYLEDLNVKGMIRNRHLAKSIQDAAWSELVRQIEHKAKWSGRRVIRIDMFTPSSKTCHVCGAVNKDLKVKDRTWTCPQCGAVHDRDHNAAKVIKQVGQGILLSDVKPVERKTSVLSFKRKGKPAFVKQEAQRIDRLHGVSTP